MEASLEADEDGNERPVSIQLMEASLEADEDGNENGHFTLLGGGARACCTEKGRETFRRARDGAEVMICVSALDSSDDDLGHTSSVLQHGNEALQLMFVLGEEDADRELSRTFLESPPVQVASERLGIRHAKDFSQFVQCCLRAMADGACVHISPQGAAHINAPASMELRLAGLEPAEWDLPDAAKVALAAKKRQMGNGHLQSGRLEIALRRYRDALGLVEFDDHFEDDDEEEEEEEELGANLSNPDKPLLGCSWMRSRVPIHAVHAEREKCLANLAAVVLRTYDFTNAITYCKRALALNEKNAKVWFRKGQAEVALGDIDAAVQSFSEAVQLAPGDSEAAGALRDAQISKRTEAKENRASERKFFSPKEQADEGSAGYVKPAAALWDGATSKTNKVLEQHLAASPPATSEEERASQVEYNKRQLMYHLEQNKHKDESDNSCLRD